jgi:hypothetical protein
MRDIEVKEYELLGDNEDCDPEGYNEVIGVKSYKRPQPMQDIEWDGAGVIRFRSNALVRYLLDAGGLTLNDLAILPNISGADWEQLAQLIGYSVSGWGGLSYVSTEACNKADEIAHEVAKTPEVKDG